MTGFTTQRAADRSIQSELKKKALPHNAHTITTIVEQQKPGTLNTAMRKLSVTLRHVYKAEKNREKETERVTPILVITVKTVSDRYMQRP